MQWYRSQGEECQEEERIRNERNDDPLVLLETLPWTNPQTNHDFPDRKRLTRCFLSQT